MKQSNDELNLFYTQVLKWAARGAFILIAAIMTYVSTRQSYNFSHWVPHPFLKDIGVPYTAVLWSEQNADLFLHFFGAMVLTLLIYWAKIRLFEARPAAIFLLVSLLCLAAEAFQFSIGRGVESSDLLLGIIGSFMAYSTFNKKN